MSAGRNAWKAGTCVVWRDSKNVLASFGASSPPLAAAKPVARRDDECVPLQGLRRHAVSPGQTRAVRGRQFKTGDVSTRVGGRLAPPASPSPLFVNVNSRLTRQERIHGPVRRRVGARARWRPALATVCYRTMQPSFETRRQMPRSTPSSLVRLAEPSPPHPSLHEGGRPPK